MIYFSVSTNGDKGIDQYHIQEFYDFDQLFNNEWEIIRNLVKRSKYFSDYCKAIRFEDDYALDFFSLMPFLEVISISENLIFSYYLLPFIFWQCAIRCLN